jgi:hypothetical protein
MNSLIEKLSSREFPKYGYFWIEDDRVTVQAYEDDIILFPGSLK